ncbi:MAG TPA: ROK family protein [Acidimicrobiales bacterium]|nr:ROK family protein [Acidimicrobiales bacterium]
MPATIGIDLGGTKCLGVVLDDAGRVQAEYRMPTPPGEDQILDTIVAVAEALGGAEQVGVGVPGLVDRAGVLQFAPNLVGADGLAVKAELEARLPGTQARIDNDATCATWAEKQLGAARELDYAIVLTLGTGIGGGIISGGRLERGANGFAGEMGHMVVAPDGEGCVCGQQGCWEFFASGRAIGRFGREAAAAGKARRVLELAGGNVDAIQGEHVSAACQEGDDDATAIIARVGWWVGIGLVNLAMAFDPQAFVIGGGLVEIGEPLFAPVRQTLAESLAGAPRRQPPLVVPAELGEQSGAVGAALLAREA